MKTIAEMKEEILKELIEDEISSLNNIIRLLDKEKTVIENEIECMEKMLSGDFPIVPEEDITEEELEEIRHFLDV